MRMLRNLGILKSLLLRPTRSDQYSAGPSEVKRTAMATIATGIARTIEANNASAKSNSRFTQIPFRCLLKAFVYRKWWAPTKGSSAYLPAVCGYAGSGGLWLRGLGRSAALFFLPIAGLLAAKRRLAAHPDPRTTVPPELCRGSQAVLASSTCRSAATHTGVAQAQVFPPTPQPVLMRGPEQKLTEPVVQAPHPCAAAAGWLTDFRHPTPERFDWLRQDA